MGDSVSGSDSGDLYRLPCHTLPDLLEKFRGETVDILKIDIEGAEYELIAGDPGILACVSWVIIEIHEVPGRKTEEVNAWIESAGFEAVPPKGTPIENNVHLFRNRGARALGTRS